VLNVYLAQAYYGDRRYDEAIDAIDAVPSLVQYPALYGILAESYWQLGDHGEAYDTLSRAIELFPGETQFLRQQIFYLIDLDLTREAIERSLVYLERLDDDPDAYVTVGEALRRGGEARLAVETLEMGALRNPSDQRIRLALAQAYLDVGMVRTAGAIVERAAAYDPALYVEAAEIFRRAGDYPRALYLNSLVLDEARKALQRFHLLLATERYESAVALETRLLRTANLEDDANRYAMAFALYQTRQFGRAIGYLNQIDGSDFFVGPLSSGRRSRRSARPTCRARRENHHEAQRIDHRNGALFRGVRSRSGPVKPGRGSVLRVLAYRAAPRRGDRRGGGIGIPFERRRIH
jgi:tetratricopeptide (TPR) repeat protein